VIADEEAVRLVAAWIAEDLAPARPVLAQRSAGR